jgi:outer membrane protein OmpA-like peptidoglycan-associated protein
MISRLLPAALVTTTLVLGGCAADDPNRRAKTGAAVGAVAGAVLGHQLDDDAGRFVGAAVGALAGGAVGNYMDRQERAFEDRLAEERAQNQMELERLRDDTLKVTLDSEVSFGFDEAAIKPAFKPSLDKLADLLREYDRTVVHVVGHTDAVGPAEYNQRLSERRAEAVADYLIDRGVTPERIVVEGRGETEPRATNETEAGRQLNRRVELYLKPVVEGEERRAYEAPAYRY